jgi:predicted nucleic acid-binding protein
VILVDSGPLVAGGAANDPHHQVCTDLLGSATEELLVPATVSAEVCYMLETRAGSKSEAAFLRLFPVGKLVPVDITTADYERMAELVELYADLATRRHRRKPHRNRRTARSDHGSDPGSPSLRSHSALSHRGLHFASRDIVRASRAANR